MGLRTAAVKEVAGCLGNQGRFSFDPNANYEPKGDAVMTYPVPCAPLKK